MLLDHWYCLQAAEQEPEAARTSFYSHVCGLEESQRIAQTITDGIASVVDKVQVVLVYWEKKYKSIWETDKAAFIRCARLSPPCGDLICNNSCNRPFDFQSLISLSPDAALDHRPMHLIAFASCLPRLVARSCHHQGIRRHSSEQLQRLLSKRRGFWKKSMTRERGFDLGLWHFHRRYERANKTLDAYQADITQYNVTIEEILLENATEAVRFLSLECGPLKQVSPSCVRSSELISARSCYLLSAAALAIAWRKLTTDSELNIGKYRTIYMHVSRCNPTQIS